MKFLETCLGKIAILVFLFSMPLTGWGNEIKPGVVITKDNYAQYSSSLKKLLIPSCYQHIIGGEALKRGEITIPVVKRKWNYQPPQGFREASRKNQEEKRCRIGPGKTLLGYNNAGGIPFPHPQNALELAWNAYRNRGALEDKEFPADFKLFSPEGKQERWFSWHLWKKMWIGRTDLSPIPQIMNNNGIIDSKESIIIDRPHDVKGFCMIRIRYSDLERADDCYSYIPALRRVRRLTGSDLTDPLLGSDAIPDDFEGWRQKINPKMTFQNLGAIKFLVPRTYTIDEMSPHRGERKGFISGTCFQVEWEIRPLWVLKIDVNDSDYLYQRRMVYADSEEGTTNIYAGDNYDHRGRLCRAYTFLTPYFNPQNLYPGMCSCVYRNILTGHSSLLDMYFNLDSSLNVPAEIFTIRGLLKKAR